MIGKEVARKGSKGEIRNENPLQIDCKPLDTEIRKISTNILAARPLLLCLAVTVSLHLSSARISGSGGLENCERSWKRGTATPASSSAQGSSRPAGEAAASQRRGMKRKAEDDGVRVPGNGVLNPEIFCGFPLSLYLTATCMCCRASRAAA